ncbi:serine/threonine-protein kinase [Tuwongella immobilis]|uniref:Protein kinase domain-containing protein n=1 Tax=Tuwongella immobilis TaxID=692036 RepID=A0A6C2YNB1_9BACT|nr:serine/threonine-protein kinase [Tuwongella immobilis]VIP02926.1 serine threonine protein kinase : Serine/threonine protein kinase OS=Isosphaera pallida (strain ATCC 43644 / DSM 9630 / IS1B) GN=Isop_2359 PE=4 SV=1: Pkinase [Tuwongella immobilis]VTS02866.1 serine threonine protein kinase : Serine/threonine protein kinase OS=Isosphaera pallida (strain ATCC 43644 / DSM 9630 / IS1B) GN=Isop_2359 PE=4 SV=1: Pkinase [Tuwongella immobilis]
MSPTNEPSELIEPFSDELLIQFIRRELPLAERRRIEDALDESPELDARVQQLRQRIAASVLGDPSNAPTNRAWLRNLPQQMSLEQLQSKKLPRIPDLEWHAELSYGGNASVFLASHPQHGFVAVKIVSLSHLPGAVERVVKERDYLQQCQDIPGVLRLYDSGIDPGNQLFWMTLEWAVGKSLQESLPETALPAKPHVGRPGEREAIAQHLQSVRAQAHDWVRLLRDAVGVLAAIHEKGVLHRDLKAANLLLQPEDRNRWDGSLSQCQIRVADFGAGRAIDEQPGHTLIGTPEFFPPEVLAGRAATPQSDMFQIGCLLYQFLTGGLPFTGRNAFDLMNAISYQRAPALLPDSAGELLHLERIALRCLERDPARRYRTIDALRRDFDSYLAAEYQAIQAPGYTRLRRMGWFCRRNWVALASISVLMVMSGMLLGWNRDAQKALIESGKATREFELRSIAAENLVAEKNKGELQQLITRAHDFARVGNWRESLPLYDQAIDRSEPTQQIQLKLESLPGYYAQGKIRELDQTLAELTQSLSHESPEYPLLLMHRASRAICDPAEVQKARELAARALEYDRQSPRLSQADRWFTSALARTRTRDCVDDLRQAIRVDRFHFLAQTTYSTLIAGLGHRDEAMVQAEFLESIFPDSPVADVVRSLVALTETDSEKLRAATKRAATRLAPEDLPSWKKVEKTFLGMVAIHQILVDFQPSNVFAMLRLGQLGGSVHQELSKSDHFSVLPFPSFGILIQRWRPVWDFAVNHAPSILLGQQITEQIWASLDQLIDDYPDRTLILARASNRLGVLITESGLNGDASRESLLEMGREMADAMQQPSLLNIRRMTELARAFSMFVDLGILKLVPNPDPGTRDRFRRNLSDLLPFLKVDREFAQKVPAFFGDLVMSPLTPHQFETFWGHGPAVERTFRDRQQELSDFCWLLIDQIDVESGPSQANAKLRVRLELWAESAQLTREILPMPRLAPSDNTRPTVSP